MSHLKADKFDTGPLVEGLIQDARYAVGGPGWRMVGPEIEDFIKYDVRAALHAAFSKAESLYIREQIAQAEQSSRTLLEGVLAGAELSRRFDEEEGVE